MTTNSEVAAVSHIALLRGINLGAARRIAMPKLCVVLANAGYRNIRTLDQSGNVILDAESNPSALERELAELLARAFGLVVPVVVRTRDELARVIERNPLRGVAGDPKLYQVSFLQTEPPPHTLRELETAAVAPEQVIVIGREIYAWHPRGIARSSLAKLITDKRLGVQVTARNWRTLTKLLALANEPMSR
jgi:uncharacterized protein (DUF1697 family)